MLWTTCFGPRTKIEEYEIMLKLPTIEKVGVHLYKGSYVVKKKVAKLIGLPMDQTDFESRRAIQGWNKTFLEDHLETLAKNNN